MTTEMAMNDAQMPSEVSSHLSTSVGKSKYSFRLFFFTFLSILACAAALANVAAAATSGEDQYIEKVPTGGGDTQSEDNSFAVVDSNGDGVVSETEVKDAAKKKAKAKKDKPEAEDEGASGATGAAAGAAPTPPAAESVATAAKFGPFSRNTALIIGALVLLGGFAISVLGGSGSGLFGIGGNGRASASGGSSGPPTN